MSQLPPTKFSIQPHILLQRNLWYYNIHTTLPATTKSFLPTKTTTRCNRANQRPPQIRYVTGNPNSYPGHNDHHHHRLCDSSSYVYYPPLHPDPFDFKKKLMEFTGVVKRGGKFYATSLQGALVEMEVRDSRLEVTAVGVAQAVPSVAWRFLKEYLVEMEEEILLVFLIYEKSLEVVDFVEVFRLDSDKLEWIRVERMRGKTMFLKKRCVWVDSAEFGCRDDCVFFTQGNDNSWRVYDMKKCRILSVTSEE